MPSLKKKEKELGVLGTKDQHVIEMDLFIKGLRKDMAQAQSIVKLAYAFGFNIAVD